MCGFAGEYATCRRRDPAPRTMLKGLRKLPPATVMIVEADGRSSRETSWHAEFRRQAGHASWDESDWGQAALAALHTAVERRIGRTSPSPYCCPAVWIRAWSSRCSARAVSVDSPRLVSVGFDAVGREGNEFDFSDMAARRFETDHHQIHVATDRMLPALDGAIGAMSEPFFAGYSWYPPLADADGTRADT